MDNNINKKLENQLYYKWIDDIKLKKHLTYLVGECKKLRSQPQKEVSYILQMSLTKVKEIENGSCKDFNSINNYINYFDMGINFNYTI